MCEIVNEIKSDPSSTGTGATPKTKTEQLSTSDRTSQISSEDSSDIKVIDKSEPEPSKKSREIAVQTSFELKSLVPKVKNVATTTTTTAFNKRSKTISLYKKFRSLSKTDEENKTISTQSITDDDNYFDDDDEEDDDNSKCKNFCKNLVNFF